MHRTSVDLRVFVILNAVVGGSMSVLLVCIGMWSIIHGDRSPLMVAAGALVITVLTTWGLWRLHAWGLVLSWIAATAALGQTGWWLWTEYRLSTEAERQSVFGAMLHPAIVIFWVWPVVWLIYSTRSHIRVQFRR